MLNLKRNLFVICFLLVSLNVFSQTKSPIIGYDKVAWGASIQAVTQVYPTIRDQTAELDASDKAIGIRQFRQNNVGNGIESRFFYFFNNKLYKVVVFYEELDEDEIMAVIHKLIDIYGDYDKRDAYSKPFLDDYTNKFFDYIIHYNKDLTITYRLMGTYDRYDREIEHSVTCLYSNPNIEQDINRARAKQKGNSLGL